MIVSVSKLASGIWLVRSNDGTVRKLKTSKSSMHAIQRAAVIYGKALRRLAGK